MSPVSSEVNTIWRDVFVKLYNNSHERSRDKLRSLNGPLVLSLNTTLWTKISQIGSLLRIN